MLPLAAASSRLAEWGPDQARVAALDFFAALPLEITAAGLGFSPATAPRE